MKILYLVHRIPYPPNKGEKIRAFHQVKYLAKHHKVDLVCLLDNKSDLSHIAPLGDICNRIYAHQITPLLSKLKGLYTQIVGSSVSVGYFHRRRVQNKIDQWMAQTEYDLIFCYSSTMAEYYFRSNFYNKESRPRLLIDFVDVDSDKWRQYAEKSSFPIKQVFQCEHSRMQQFEQRIYSEFDASILISQNEAKLFTKQVVNENKIFVIPNGIDSLFFDKHKLQDAKSIEQSTVPLLVFTGAMDYHANVDGVLWFSNEVLPRIRKAHPHVQFKIVGSNPTSVVKQLSEREGIEVTGFVEDIRPYYEQADVYVAPLRLGRGLQNKVLEAMAFERPIVATSRANAGIQAFNGKHLFIADDPESFADKVNELISCKNLRAQIGTNAREFVIDNFNWETNLDVLMELINNLVPDC